MNEKDLTELMRANRPTIDGEVRQAHLASIASALGEVPAPSRWRRLAVGSAVGLVLVGPASLAAAASSALPGDPLYGTKRVVEDVVSLINDDFAAGRRLSEAEWLLANGGSLEIIRDLLEDAREDVTPDSSLSARLDELWSLYLAQTGVTPGESDPVAIDSDDDTTTEDEADEPDDSGGLGDDSDDSDSSDADDSEDSDDSGSSGDSHEDTGDSDDSDSSDQSGDSSEESGSDETDD